MMLISWNNKGNSLKGLGRHEEAINSYEKALEIDSKYTRALESKVKSLEELGRHEEAIRTKQRLETLGGSPLHDSPYTK